MRPETPLPGPDWGRYYDRHGVEHHCWPASAAAVEPAPEPIAVARHEEVQMQVAAAEILIDVVSERRQERQSHRPRVGQPTLF